MRIGVFVEHRFGVEECFVPRNTDRQIAHGERDVRQRRELGHDDLPSGGSEYQSVCTTPARATCTRARWNDKRFVRVLSEVTTPCRILLISGSLRRQSTNTAVLRTAQAFAADDIEAVRYDGVRDLPHFDPDLDVAPLDPAAAELRRQVREADALLFSTPEYAGALPGSFKNLLDWTIGDDQPGSIYEKPVAWINASARGAVHAHESLRLVLSYAHADIVTAACVDVAVHAVEIGDDGLVTDAGTRERIVFAIAQPADYACRRSDDDVVA